MAVEVAREVGAQHLTIRHDVVAGLLLVQQRDAGAITQRLGDVGRPQSPLADGVPDEPHPGRRGGTAERLDRQQG